VCHVLHDAGCYSEDNLNYTGDEGYVGRGGPYSGDYNSYNGGPHLDTSMHSSHHSLHSNSNNTRAQVRHAVAASGHLTI